MKLLKHVFRKIIIIYLFNKYVTTNSLIKEDVLQNFRVKGCKPLHKPLKKQFEHLMHYYPDFALIFFWRINRSNHFWKRFFTKDIPFKIFKSTKIAGGMMCYHPFATVINAKSIGVNFQFRNGLTIGNKNNDNTLIPIIGNNVIVGANVVIIGDITIGDDVVVGAGSVVVKDVPSKTVIAGNPAKIIRKIDEI